MRMLMILCLLILASCGYKEKGLIFSDKIDRFSGERTISSINANKGDPFNLRLQASFWITDTKKGKIFLASLDTLGSQDWQFLQCHNTNWLANGYKITPQKVEHSGKVGRYVYGTVRENIWSIFEYNDFARLAQANKVEYKICNTEGELTEKEMIGLKKVYNSYIIKTQ